MSFYVYIQPDGYPSITEYPIDLKTPWHNEWFLLEVKETRPDYTMQRYVNGKWTWGMQESEDKMKRRSATAILDLMDDLYEAMKDGEMPKAKKFFNRMDALHKKYPNK